ncbi:MAG: DNA starvation/stationary phase protection protein [Verrucomicrobia bacterium]|nr:DNA starvation/stationary phase protection protein [Verrucomicrobiota bacterium]
MSKQKKKPTTTVSKKNSKLQDALRVVLADTYALMAQTHLCHWNVEGPSFFALHAAFEVQYTELFTASDELAERLRALGFLAPGGLSSLAALAGIKELPEDCSDKDMVRGLAAAHEKLIRDASLARDLAGEAGDNETEDLMIARIQLHQKTLWMLTSYLK